MWRKKDDKGNENGEKEAEDETEVKERCKGGKGMAEEVVS